MNRTATESAPVAARPVHPAPKSRRAWLLAGVALALVVGGGWFFQKRGAAGPSGAPAAPGSAAANRPLPVVLATAKLEDVPLYLEGIGNATPLATVTIKTQVDGRLEKIFFTEGQRVKRGELLAQVDPRPFQIALQQAQAAIARDTANAENARKNQQRYEALVEQKLIAQQQVDDQRALADAAAAAVASGRAAAANASLQLEYSKIRSPIDGVTGVRLVDPGNIVHAADPGGIVVVTQLDPMAVVFTLPEDALPRVSQALSAGKVTVEAYSRDASNLLGTGELLLVDNQINQQTATIKLKARVPNPERALWPNAFIKARLLLGTRENALVVPATAIQRGPQGTFVYLVDAAKKVSVRPVVVDATEGERALLKSGISAGDQVVIEGQTALRAGATVQPRPPAGGGAQP